MSLYSLKKKKKKEASFTDLPSPVKTASPLPLKASLLVRATLMSPVESREASPRHAASPNFELGELVATPADTLCEAGLSCWGKPAPSPYLTQGPL